MKANVMMQYRKWQQQKPEEETRGIPRIVEMNSCDMEGICFVQVFLLLRAKSLGIFACQGIPFLLLCVGFEGLSRIGIWHVGMRC